MRILRTILNFIKRAWLFFMHSTTSGPLTQQIYASCLALELEIHSQSVEESTKRFAEEMNWYEVDWMAVSRFAHYVAKMEDTDAAIAYYYRNKVVQMMHGTEYRSKNGENE